MGLTIGLMEVLVHSVAFWQRLKQSSVMQRVLMQVQDFEQDGDVKKKASKVLSSLGKDKHSDIPSPIDFTRYRKQVETPGGALTSTNFHQLDAVSQLLPAYDHQMQNNKLQASPASVPLKAPQPRPPQQVPMSQGQPISRQPLQVAQNHSSDPQAIMSYFQRQKLQ